MSKNGFRENTKIGPVGAPIISFSLFLFLSPTRKATMFPSPAPIHHDQTKPRATTSIVAMIQNQLDVSCQSVWRDILKSRCFSGTLQAMPGLTEHQIKEFMIRNWPEDLNESDKDKIRFAIRPCKANESLYEISVVLKSPFDAPVASVHVREQSRSSTFDNPTQRGDGNGSFSDHVAYFNRPQMLSATTGFQSPTFFRLNDSTWFN